MSIPLIIDVQLNDETLQTGLDKLQAQGTIDSGTAVIFKKTNDELAARKQLFEDVTKSTSGLTVSVSAQQATYNKLALSVKTLSGEAKNAAQALLLLNPDKLSEGFKESGINVEDLIEKFQKFSDQADKATDSQVNLRTQILTINDALTKLKLAGEDNTEIFKNLEERSAVLTKALKEQREAVANIADENPKLHALQTAVEGVTGAFEVGIGITGLFGQKNKDLEETLIKVNSIMVFAQGAQSVFNALRKESALVEQAEAFALKVSNVQLALQKTIEEGGTVAKIAATVAQKALNAALAANPVGLLITVLVAATAAILSFTEANRLAEEQQQSLNEKIQDSVDLHDANQASIKRTGDDQLAALDALNAKESEKARAQAKTLQAIAEDKVNRLADIDGQIFANEESRDAKIMATVEQLKKDKIKAEEDVKVAISAVNNANLAGQKIVADEALQATKDLADAQLAIAGKNAQKIFAAQRVQANAQLAQDLKNAGDDEEKKFALRAQFRERLKQIDDAEQAQNASDRQSLISAQLLQEQTESRRINTQISQEETNLQKQALIEKANDEIAVRGTTAAKALEIQKKLQLDLEQLDRDQLNREIVAANQNEIAKNNIQLASIQTSNKKREELEIQNELDNRAIALTNEALTDKGREAIVAQSEEKIRQIRLQARQKELEDEITITAANAQHENSELQRQLDAQAQIRSSKRPAQTAQVLGVPILNLDQQKRQIDDLTQFALDQNAKRIDNNQDNFQKGLITQEEFNKQSAVLTAESTRIHDDGENKKKQTTLDTLTFQQETTKKIIAVSLQGVAQGLSILQSLYQQQDQAAQDRLDKQKQRIQDELDAGEITAKAAAVRNKELDAQQKQLALQQAKRNKELAIFQAIIGTATAVIQALDAPPPLSFISAAIAAALGAAQIAVIASQPLPAFYLGKNQKQRDDYQGWGIIGDRGTELWRSGSQMRVADKPTIVWLNKKDTVYTAKETKEIMNRVSTPSMKTETPVMHIVTNNKIDFDYKKMADSVARRVPIVLNIDGYKAFLKDQEQFTEYLYNRRKWL